MGHSPGDTEAGPPSGTTCVPPTSAPASPQHPEPVPLPVPDPPPVPQPPQPPPLPRRPRPCSCCPAGQPPVTGGYWVLEAWLVAVVLDSTVLEPSIKTAPWPAPRPATAHLPPPSPPPTLSRPLRCSDAHEPAPSRLPGDPSCRLWGSPSLPCSAPKQHLAQVTPSPETLPAPGPRATTLVSSWAMSPARRRRQPAL